MPLAWTAVVLVTRHSDNERMPPQGSLKCRMGIQLMLVWVCSIVLALLRLIPRNNPSFLYPVDALVLALANRPQWSSRSALLSRACNSPMRVICHRTIFHTAGYQSFVMLFDGRGYYRGTSVSLTGSYQTASSIEQNCKSSALKPWPHFCQRFGMGGIPLTPAQGSCVVITSC